MKVIHALLAVCMAVALAAGEPRKMCVSDPTPSPTPSMTSAPTPTTPTPTTWTPAACPPLAIDILFEGYDCSTVLDQHSVGSCCDQCRETTGCVSFTRWASQSICYLFSTIGSYATVSRTGFMSGVLTASKPCNLLPSGIQLTGHVSSTIRTNTVKACCLECSRAGATCKGYAYNTGTQECNFLDAIDCQVTAPSWASGLAV